MIIATGFHNSGTTPIAKALHKLGVLFEGPHTHEIENKMVRRINEEALFALTGNRDGWIVPSPVDVMDYFVNVPTELIHINWKDPRGCLTIPIWQPHVKSIVLIRRNEGNLIKSASATNGKEKPEMARLIPIYIHYAQIWADWLGLPIVETWYEDWYAKKDPFAVREVLQFCGTDKSNEEIMEVLNEMRQPRNQ